VIDSESGVTEPRKLDGIYRAAQRRESTHWRQRAAAVARDLRINGNVTPESGKAQLLETRRQVVGGWSEVADDLVRQGEVQLAGAVRDFVKQMPPVVTEREWIRDRMLEQARTRDERGAYRRRVGAQLDRRDARGPLQRDEPWRDLDGYSR